MSKNKKELDVYGQYASDRFLSPEKIGTDKLGVSTRGDGTIGFHGETSLFDEGIGVMDDATGLRKLETRLEDQMLEVEGMRIETVQTIGHDAIGSNEADAWMEQHGFKW